MMLSLSTEKSALAGRGKLTRQVVTKKTARITDNEEMSDVFNFFLSKVNPIRHVKSIMTVSQKNFSSVFARSEATTQSPDLELLHPMRLLRYARNDIKRDFLPDNQLLAKSIFAFILYQKEEAI